MLESPWRYLGFIASSIRAKCQVRYARRQTGILWMIAQTHARVEIFAFMRSELLASRVPNVLEQFAYAIHLVAWPLPWPPFADDRTHSLSAKGGA